MKKLINLAVICIILASLTTSCRSRKAVVMGPQQGPTQNPQGYPPVGYPQGQPPVGYPQGPQPGVIIMPGIQMVPFSQYCNATTGMLMHPPVDNVRWECTYAADGSSNCTVQADDAGIEVVIAELNGNVVNQINITPALYTNPGIDGLAKKCYFLGSTQPKHTYPRAISVWRVWMPATGPMNRGFWQYYCQL